MKKLYFLLFTLFAASPLFATVGPITGTANMCLGESRTLHDTTAGGRWSSSDTSIASVDSLSGSVIGISLGTCIITYTAGTGYSVLTVTVNPLPATFTVTGGGSYCAGGTGVHIGLDGSQSGVTYMLYHGSSSIGPVAGSGGTVDFGPLTVAGAYTAVATSITTGCTSNMTDSAVVVITPTVTPTVRVTAAHGDSICTGTSSTFTAVPTSGGSTPTYQWKVNSTIVGTSAPTYTFVPANGDTVRVKLTSNATCASPLTARDSMIALVIAHQIPSVSIMPTPGDTVCLGYPATMVPTSGYGGTAPAYRWYVNGASQGISPVYTYVPVDGDTVYCEMTSNFFCRTTDSVRSATIKLNVIMPVIPTFYIDAYPGSIVHAGGQDTFVAVVAPGALGLSYQWYVNGHLAPGATFDTFVLNTIDTFYDSVSCVITSHGYCNLTTVNWTYVITGDQAVPGVNALKDFTVFPNPNNGAFTVAGTLGGVSDAHIWIDVTDMIGKRIYTDMLAASGGKVNAQVILPQPLASGIYVVSFHTATGMSGNWMMKVEGSK